jgi:cytochrome P450
MAHNMTQPTITTIIRSEIRPQLPPSAPGGAIIFGSARSFQRDSLQFIQTLAALGDVVRYRFVVWPTLFLNHPDYIKHVLQENSRNYDKDVPTNRLFKTVLGTGLFTDDGASWLRQRRLIQPAFHRQRIAGFGSLMTSAAAETLARWDERPTEDAPLDVAAEMMGLTLRVVGLALFGADVSDDVEVVRRSFTTIVDFLTRAAYEPFVMFPGVPARGKRQFQTAHRELDQLVYRIIARRRLHTSDRDDLLSMLLTTQDEETGTKMTDRQVRDEVMTLLLAGHETTSVALSWTWYLLSTHPDAESRLHAELDAVLGGRLPRTDDLPQLAYTRMVIEEALRLYPPAWAILRRAIDDDHIGPYRIRPGTTIFISPYAIHRHPAFWENPEAFDPERFTPERSAGRSHFAYLPFGGGPRRCIGNMFALTEAQLILATVAQRYRLRVVPGHTVEPMPLITLRLCGGLPVRAERIS